MSFGLISKGLLSAKYPVQKLQRISSHFITLGRLPDLNKGHVLLSSTRLVIVLRHLGSIELLDVATLKNLLGTLDSWSPIPTHCNSDSLCCSSASRAHCLLRKHLVLVVTTEVKVHLLHHLRLLVLLLLLLHILLLLLYLLGTLPFLL